VLTSDVSSYARRQLLCNSPQSFKHKAWDALIVINSIVVTVFNNLLLPITEEVRESTGQRTISNFVMCCSKIDEEGKHLIEVLTKWSLTIT